MWRIPSGPPGARATSVLHRHSREFCVPLSGQVADGSARARAAQAMPALCRDLTTVALDYEFSLVFHPAVSPSRP